MFEAVKKKYRLKIIFKTFFGRPKEIHFIYEQAPIRELIRMQQELRGIDKIREWIFDFLVKKTQSSDKLTDRLYRQLSDYRIIELFEFILKTYGKDFFIQKDEEENVKKKNTLDANAPSSSTICFILEHTNETLESLLDMSYEQMNYLIDGIVWNINEQTNEGKERNARSARMKQMMNEMTKDEIAERVKRVEEKMAKRKNQ